MRSASEVWTEYGLLLFGVLFLAVRWRARGRSGTGPVALAALFVLALAGPAGRAAAAMRASGLPSVVWFTGPGPAR
ncbi:hypothetical protein [Streptomyces sp. NPDC048349]|uniref:hypothetical protein n=1 Tax=Streptomyces sp. NPDC048349 TaxID=3155486 RepID=UPI003418FE96